MEGNVVCFFFFFFSHSPASPLHCGGICFIWGRGVTKKEKSPTTTNYHRWILEIRLYCVYWYSMASMLSLNPQERAVSIATCVGSSLLRDSFSLSTVLYLFDHDACRMDKGTRTSRTGMTDAASSAAELRRKRRGALWPCSPVSYRSVGCGLLSFSMSIKFLTGWNLRLQG